MSNQNLFNEPGLKQITVWGRGVYENKEARDVVVSLTEAAALEGKYVQAWENYVDLPDRIYVPVRAYGKISSQEIESKYVYENEAPDIVVLTEETLVKGVDVLAGIKPGAVLVVNTKRSPEYLFGFIKKNTENLSKIVTVDANSLSKSIITLSGAEGATDASGIGKGIGAVLAAAAVKGTEIVKFDNLLKIVVNKNAAKKAYKQAVVIDVNTIPKASV
ncbi:oxalate oxidoreductase subunit delta [Clostridium luticellarii]|uniref:Pyruvate synthase subunit PorC n=1 Tax=Clostridium luticellarii TaxID=1691940 RepID=A0A2T0BMI6_9CLOT|nr:2-oxoacid:acceptor oxidoreductase family protein [Clostridium luticellarii]MCI1945272.1 2-oxoacid:acceptor oxidoreductase family protein [Clostridium luticellarii]MCI1969012.1 2-oxoacid:acceptor oxidoreductase family protein [Clostridium luticellarii]MCI1994605.1 2-oxoacid:acceptor oxidoreductase family protein [Clostridium luticellarii]MCI2038898.1 2-oxoacid:acceptor oxidoreductase family protein [Clostridium luticellarii]PRR85076.1 Pyruvate synthase subunit PorC [Clostridium luticellarii]